MPLDNSEGVVVTVASYSGMVMCSKPTLTPARLSRSMMWSTVCAAYSGKSETCYTFSSTQNICQLECELLRANIVSRDMNMSARPSFTWVVTTGQFELRRSVYPKAFGSSCIEVTFFAYLPFYVVSVIALFLCLRHGHSIIMIFETAGRNLRYV